MKNTYDQHAKSGEEFLKHPHALYTLTNTESSDEYAFMNGGKMAFFKRSGWV